MEPSNKCRKFEANIFNKSKCQNCFKPKEEHSAEALENCRNSRKIARCGYLFVAPESFDFTSSLDRTRRWQRRFFVLYDDGELTYSVDENPGTVPQGSVDMNYCTDVHSAEAETGHQLSIAVVLPKGTTYIKGGAREEINRWQDVLSVYVGSAKIKSKKIIQKSFSQPGPTCHTEVRRHENLSTQAMMASAALRASPAQAHGSDGGNYPKSSLAVPSTESRIPQLPPSPADENMETVVAGIPSTTASSILVDRLPSSALRGVRGLKHKNESRSLRHGTGSSDMYKATSLQDLTNVGAVADRSGGVDGANMTSQSVSGLEDDAAVGVRSSLHGSLHSFSACMIDSYSSACMFSVPPPDLSDDAAVAGGGAAAAAAKPAHGRRSRGRTRRCATDLELEFVTRTGIVSNTAQFWEDLSSESDASMMSAVVGSRSRGVSEDRRRDRTTRRDPSTSRYSTICAPCDISVFSNLGIPSRSRFASDTSLILPVGSLSASSPKQIRSNETDEFKMAKSTDVVAASSDRGSESGSEISSVSLADSGYIKKGWLLKQSTDKREWVRCWFVLVADALTSYQDSKDELTNAVESSIALTPSTEVLEQDTAHNYAFRVSNRSAEFVLSATTPGMRRIWIDAILSCIRRTSFPDAAAPHLESHPPAISTSKDVTEIPSSRRSNAENLTPSRMIHGVAATPPSARSSPPVTSSLVRSSVGTRHRQLLADSELVDGMFSPLKTNFAPEVTSSVEAVAPRRGAELNENSHDYLGSSRWKEVEDSSNESSAGTDGAGDNTLVELLETEVASLRRQLELSQTQLTDLRRVNHDQRRRLERNLSSEHLLSDSVRQDDNSYDVVDSGSTAFLQEKLKQMEAAAETGQLKAKSLKRKLSQALKTMKSQKKEIESLQDQLSETPVKLRGAIDLEVNQAVREMKEDRDRLRQSISGLESINLDLEKRLAETLADMKGLGDRARKCADLEAEVERLRRQLEARSEERQRHEELARELREKLTATEQRAQNALSAKVQENETLKRDLNASQKETSSLREKLNSCLKDDTSKKLSAELSRKEMENARLCEEVAGLEDRLNELNEDNVRLKESLQQMDENCRSLRKQLELREGDLNRLTGELSRKSSESTAMRKLYEQEISQLKSSQSSRASASEQGGSEKMLKDENARLKYELKDCQGRLEKVVGELEGERLRQRESLLEKDRNIARLQRSLNEQHLMNRRLDGDGRESGNSDDFRMDSGSPVDDGKDGKSAAEKSRKQLEAELQRSEQRCSDLESKLGNLKKELRIVEIDREDKMNRLEAQLSDLSTKLASSDRRNRRLEQERALSTGSRASSTSGVGEEKMEKVDRTSFSILSLMQSPIGDEPNANVETSAVSRQLENVTKAARAPGELENELADEILRLRRKVSELELELKKASKPAASLDFPDGKDDVCVGPDSQHSVLVGARLSSVGDDSQLRLAADRRVAQLEARIRDLQADYEQELALQRAAHRRELERGKDEVLQLLASAEASHIPVDEELVRRKYMKEIERIKEMYDRGFSAMEKSHHRAVLEMKMTHKLEIDRLCQEKDELLRMEAQDTQAALEAMRKAHEMELDKERTKFQNLLSEMGKSSDRESLQKQHDEDMASIRREIHQLTEQYSIKCLECATLSERLEAQTKALHESRRRIHDLLARNDELNTRLKFDIDRVNRTLERRISQANVDTGDADSEKLQNFKMALDMKQTEIVQLQEQLARVEHQLHLTSEELKEYRDKYHDLRQEHDHRVKTDNALFIDESSLSRDVAEPEPTRTSAASSASNIVELGRSPWQPRASSQTTSQRQRSGQNSTALARPPLPSSLETLSSSADSNRHYEI